MTGLTPAQIEAIQAVIDAVYPVGGGKSGIEAGVLTDFARDQPELAAIAVQGFLLVSDESKRYGSLAVALSIAYQSVFDDDTLSVIVREHYQSIGQPVPELRFQSEETAPKAQAPMHYEVSADALSECDIYPLLKAFSHRHLADDDSLARLASLGGRIFVTFPVPASDPRHVWQVPEVRAYVRAIADAMPYFPYYLATDPRLGMFEVYFGSLIDPRLLEGGTFDLTHEEIFPEVARVLVRTSQFADALGVDGAASVRALLAAFPAQTADYVVGLLPEMARQLGQESTDG